MAEADGEFELGNPKVGTAASAKSRRTAQGKAAKLKLVNRTF